MKLDPEGRAELLGRLPLRLGRRLLRTRLLGFLPFDRHQDFLLAALLAQHGKSPESQRKAQEGRDLRNEGRVEDGKAPKTTKPGTGDPEK
jgi:hypothetical protein